uniref:Uncharacterized protein n=1 Tax=Lactuca sativa TaxID=4236 RepID=A0A9R1XGP4_LACSA|nr:hypothetical protein LSAT_V11C400197590 [Lactuca sativa]
MEMNSSGDTNSRDTSIEPKEFQNFCIRQYVAEVRRKDWKKCCPFDLSSYSPEFTFQAERVFASLILEDNDALINTPENTQAPNCKRPKLV